LGRDVIFRFAAPAGTARVYLAGSFNGFAENSNGRVSDNRYAMRRSSTDVWWSGIPITGGGIKYKFVVESPSGVQTWVSDPFVPAKDGDGNTVFDVGSIAGNTPKVSVAWPRKLKNPALPVPFSGQALTVRVEKVWRRPGEPNSVRVDLPMGAAGRLVLTVSTPFGEKVCSTQVSANPGQNRIDVPPIAAAGGYLARTVWEQGGKPIAQGDTVLTVVQSIADDLRYGFYTTYRDHTGDYAAKADMLAGLGINAVEFYDYFPAHGLYAPTQETYASEPFGVKIDARDIHSKIVAGHDRNILSLAYVAAYAASESVYRAHPDPMTDERGVPKIFNGAIMPEDQADREHKPKWFWLMDVADGSPWRQYVMGQFAKALEDRPSSLVSFDGFEVDTYGDSAQTKFYAKGSPRSGDFLRSVLHDFVGEIRALTHREKPAGLVSFNSVNEFAVDEMQDATDFLFLEIWRGHTDRLEGLTDIAYGRRSSLHQRVVLKVYPADMSPSRTSWAANGLRRVLAAAMAGGGTLMVAGEPDEKGNAMHALHSLYYPDHTPLSPENSAILRTYNRYDAMLLDYTHGRDVTNIDSRPSLDGCVVRGFASPVHRALAYQFLRTGQEARWSVEIPPLAPEKDLEVTLDLPAGIAPSSVWYFSPDNPRLRTPTKLDYQVVGSKLQVRLPELEVAGTLILRY